MTHTGVRLSLVVVLGSLLSFGQAPANQTPSPATPAAPAAHSPDQAPSNQNQTPDTVAPPAKKGDQPQTSASKPATDSTPPAQRDRAQSYYHYALAHMYEEMVSVYGHSEYASKAIEEYKLALQNDPGSEELNAGLAESKSGHCAAVP